MFYLAINRIAVEYWEPSGVTEYSGVDKLSQAVRAGDGVLLFSWNETDRIANIWAIGLVQTANADIKELSVCWREATFAIRPGSAGFRHWRDKWILHLEPSRVKAYDLQQIFATAFNDPLLLDKRVDSTFILRKSISKDRESIIPEVGFVYLMFDGSIFKIGKALDILSRKKQLERQLGKSLEILHAIYSTDYTRAEAEMHYRFASKRVFGEWFELDEKDVETIKLIQEL